MAIETKSISGSYKSMDIKPGNVNAKINSITLEKVKYQTKTPEFVIYLNLETKPVGNGFVGFQKDINKPELGKYEGQQKVVANSRWSIKDFVSKSGMKISIEKQILKFIGSILNECNSTWLEDVDGKFENIAELINGLNKDKPYKDVYLNWCLGGKEKINEKGYPKYYMHLPDYKVCPVPFAAENSSKTVTKYSEELHLIKDEKAAEVNKELNEEVSAELNESPFELPSDDELFDFED